MSSPGDAIDERSPTCRAVVPSGRLVLLAVVIGLMGTGCGPTRTAGTHGIAAKELAVLSIPQLPEQAYVRIDTVTFDDAGKAYPIKNGREFYLLPGDHTAGFNLVAIRPDVKDVPTWVRWMIPGKKTIDIPGPKKLPLGRMTAGKTYELAPPTFDSIEELWREGSLSLVREKGK